MAVTTPKNKNSQIAVSLNRDSKSKTLGKRMHCNHGAVQKQHHSSVRTWGPKEQPYGRSCIAKNSYKSRGTSAAPPTVEQATNTKRLLRYGPKAVVPACREEQSALSLWSSNCSMWVSEVSGIIQLRWRDYATALAGLVAGHAQRKRAWCFLQAGD